MVWFKHLNKTGMENCFTVLTNKADIFLVF